MRLFFNGRELGARRVVYTPGRMALNLSMLSLHFLTCLLDTAGSDDILSVMYIK